MFTIGIIAGLWAAFFQSLSYLASRHFMHVHAVAGGTRKLMVLSHCWMGAASWAILPFVWPAGGMPWRALALPLFGTAFFYLLGQFGLLIALRKAQPSQVSPMLSLKILMLAIMTVVIKSQSILPVQWLAVGCCISGTFVLNNNHDRLPLQAFVVLLLTCATYAMSDWSIGYLKPAFGPIPTWQAIACGSLLCYGFCGIVAAAFLPLHGSRNPMHWRDAWPFAAAWLLGMFGLYTSFAISGVVYGGILQSTRSIMGVFLAALLTRAGYTHIEHMKGRGMFARRLAASILMTLAAILWLLKW